VPWSAQYFLELAFIDIDIAMFKHKEQSFIPVILSPFFWSHAEKMRDAAHV